MRRWRLSSAMPSLSTKCSGWPAGFRLSACTFMWGFVTGARRFRSSMPSPPIFRPFWCGYDTGLASSRSVTFGALPTAGTPQRLTDWKQFEDYMDTLPRAGTIRSIKEVWWDIRPHPDFGTVEIRMFDGVPTLREVGMVAALSQCLVQLF